MSAKQIEKPYFPDIKHPPKTEREACEKSVEKWEKILRWLENDAENHGLNMFWNLHTDNCHACAYWAQERMGYVDPVNPQSTKCPLSRKKNCGWSCHEAFGSFVSSRENSDAIRDAKTIINAFQRRLAKLDSVEGMK